MKTVVGLFDTYSHAENAVNDLVSVGISRDDISLVASNQEEQFAKNPTVTTTDSGDEMMRAAITDAGVGAGIGGVLGLLAGASVFAIPGLGWLAGAGWFAGLIGGAAVGGIVGGLIGALVHIGVPEEDAISYNEGVRRGGVLLTVRAEDTAAHQVAQILSDNGAINIDERSAQWRQEGWTPTRATTSAQTAASTQMPSTAHMATANMASSQQTLDREGKAVVPVIEEDIQIGKREVERGGARIHTYMKETPVQEQVTLREEHVTVDRRPVDRPISAADVNALRDQTIEVTERAEEPVIAKQARVVEEVIVGKEATERTETVQDTVRRTEVDVQPLSGTQQTSRTMGTYDTYASDFRNNWQTTYGSQGGRYEDYEPAYRYGYEMASSPQYRDKSWMDVESSLQQDWNRRYPQNAWDRARNSIRYAWDRATGDNTPGIQTGGRAMDGTPDTRGITEKAADALTGDRIDDKTGKVVR